MPIKIAKKGDLLADGSRAKRDIVTEDYINDDAVWTWVSTIAVKSARVLG